MIKFSKKDIKYRDKVMFWHFQFIYKKDLKHYTVL